MDISKRLAVVLACVTLLLMFAAVAYAVSLDTARDTPPAVVLDVPVRVGPSVNLTPDDPGAMKADPTSTTPTIPTTVDPTPTEPTRPTTTDPTRTRQPVHRPAVTDAREAPPTEEPEPLEPPPPNRPVATEDPEPTR